MSAAMPTDASEVLKDMERVREINAKLQALLDAQRIVSQAMHGTKVPPGYQQAKAKLPLPLGHEFKLYYGDGDGTCQFVVTVYTGTTGIATRCGQPRSAHEPK